MRFWYGATPNAMANMQAICDKYAPSVKALSSIPLIGSLLQILLTALVITFSLTFYNGGILCLSLGKTF